MKADPVLQELWKVKDELSRESNHDLRNLFEMLKRSQRNRSAKVVNLTQRRAVVR